MQTKLPASYDVSHWKEIFDFKLVKPRPALFITKATEAHPGTIYSSTDSKFVRFFEGMQEIGCTRGAYHFHRKSCNSVRQAEHFVKTISVLDILKTDILILDVEEGGETASQLWAWFEYVRASFPNNLLMLYSSKRILDPIKMTESEKIYFKRIKVWGAGYPYYPDDFSSVPLVYTPDQTKYGPVYLWQYSEVGNIEGIYGAVDLNWISPALYSIIGDTTIGESVMAIYTGTAKQNADVWNIPGGSKVTFVRQGSSIRADQKTLYSGTYYLHLTSPVVGWSKDIWFNYSESVIQPPPPPPGPTVTVTHKIDILSNGKISIDGGNSF